MFKYLLPAVVSSSILACGQARSGRPLDVSQPAEAWNDVNDPMNLKDDYEVVFEGLPLTAELEVKPWTDTYWPNYRAGIADRWNDPTRPDPFRYELNGPAEIAAMDEQGLGRLSPAEKYDVFLERFDYPLVNEERRRTSPDDPSWYGLCHGWAPAALNFKEPRPVVLESASGRKIPFGASDVKALLLYAQQYGTSSRAVGRRCNANGGEGNECRDVNAGSFHVILTNQIGLLATGFVAEVARESQVWNQPVFGYQTTVLGESGDVYPEAARGTERIVRVRTELRYIAELSPHWDPMPFAEFPGQVGRRTYEYTLELDGAGEILGGEWVSRDHPDFLWTQTPPQLTGFFAQLRRIYQAATN